MRKVDFEDWLAFGFLMKLWSTRGENYLGLGSNSGILGLVPLV